MPSYSRTSDKGIRACKLTSEIRTTSLQETQSLFRGFTVHIMLVCVSNEYLSACMHTSTYDVCVCVHICVYVSVYVCMHV